MKKIIFLLVFVAFTTTLTFGQGLFKPVPKNLFKTDGWALRKDLKPSVWLFRISAGVVATSWYIENKEIKQAAFNKVGIGGSYSHFTEVDGLPYNDVSVNGFVFFPTGEGAKITIAATVSTLKYINAGLFYDFGLKKPGLLTGIIYSF